ncbi:MAG: endolytic transglycosylase MltG [Actinomycetota bacterium]|nr:endolytic transglycosylase MltG [Actinomycetota bacterium]
MIDPRDLDPARGGLDARAWGDVESSPSSTDLDTTDAGDRGHEQYVDEHQVDDHELDDHHVEGHYLDDPSHEAPLGGEEGLFFADGHDLDDPGADEGEHDSSGGSRGQRATERRTAGRRRVRGAIVLLLALVVVAGAGVVAFGKIKPLLTLSSDSGDYPGPGTGSVSVTVNDGDTATAIGTTLEKAGVVKTAKAFAQAAAADPQGTSIQPGKYDLRSQMTATGALALLVDPANRSVPRVTLREGLWKSETFAALAKASNLPVSDYVKAAKDSAALGLPAAAKGNVEGWLFPSTYEFPEGSTAAEQLQTMVAKTTEELTSLGVADGDVEKILTVASIVQAEGRRAKDLPKIARVIDNRLAVPMRLQLDSTVSYGVQKRALTTTDAERAATNGYNTYARAGLPVGPISNPGAAAIEAAQAPADGPWIYFVAVNPQTGETKFATTAAEHAANVAQFQKWCSDHPGSC